MSSESRWLLRVASWVVPRVSRAGWLERWDSELWYRELEARRAGRSDRAIRVRVANSAAAAFPDALWQRFDRERLTSGLRSPQFCLGVLALLLVLITITTGGLERTRRIIAGPEFSGRVITAYVQELLVGRQQGLTPAALEKLRKQAKSFDALAAYVFPRPWYAEGFLAHRGPAPSRMPLLMVTPEFFRVLGVRDYPLCKDCLVVTKHFKRELLRTTEPVSGRTVDHEGRRWRITGELPADFWFLTPTLGGVTLMDDAAARGRMIGLGLLRPEVSVESAEAELRRILRLPQVNVSSVASQLRAPLRSIGTGSAGLLLLLAIVTLVSVVRRRAMWRFWTFLFVKTALAVLAVLLITIEYAGAGKLSVTGGNQPNEPVAFWLWVVGTMLCIWWSIADQKMRCRICERRFVMPVRIGSPDRVLFEHESTELVCPGGHGTLYVEGMTETFRQEGRWTKLDDSWKDLFADKP
jgi:hypothetical protein